MPLPDRHHVRRFVARTGTLDDGHLVVAGRVGPHDQVVLGNVLERVRIGQGQALQHLGHELLGIVDELFHAVLLCGSVSRARRR